MQPMYPQPPYPPYSQPPYPPYRPPYPQPPYKPYHQHSKRIQWELLIFLLLLGLVLVMVCAFLGIFLEYPSAFESILPQSQCTLGVWGHPTASITATGFDAPVVCWQLKEQTTGLYSRDPDTSQPAVCEGSYLGANIIVRDGEFFTITGAQICSSLHLP